MKRSKPLGRDKSLTRGKGPRADPERTRAFVERGRRRLRRRRRDRSGEGPLSPREWRVQVFELSGGRCIVTGARARDAFDRRFHAHHPLEKELLPDEHKWDPRNGVLVTVRAHERHTLAVDRIPRELLPARVWEFAREMDGLRPGTQWATEAVCRLHPIGGGS